MVIYQKRMFRGKGLVIENASETFGLFETLYMYLQSYILDSLSDEAGNDACHSVVKRSHLALIRLFLF